MKGIRIIILLNRKGTRGELKMSEEKGQNQSAKKEGGSRRLIIILGILIIVLLVAVIVILLLKKEPEQAQEAQQPSGREVVNESRIVLDEQSAQDTLDEMRKQVEEGMFECSMSMEWTFADGHSESKDAFVENTSNNTHPIYFDVVLDGSDDVIYSSPILPVGTQLTNFKLDVPLGAGTYHALCKYTLLEDEESQEPLSSANFVITINVLE
jgi:hypothetical protein